MLVIHKFDYRENDNLMGGVRDVFPHITKKNEGVLNSTNNYFFKN